MLWKHNLAMRMLRWLMLHDGPTTQRLFMTEYRRIGATKSSSFTDHFHAYTRWKPSDDERRVILRTEATPSWQSELRWGGPDVIAWLAATPDAELQTGFEMLERALVETNDDHFRDWVERLRAEIARRAR